MKKIFLFMFCMIVLSSFVFSSLSHDSSIVHTNCTPAGNRELAVAVINNSYTNNEFYDNTDLGDACQIYSCFIDFTFDSTYTIHNITIWDADDGSGGAYPYNFTVYVNETYISENQYDGVVSQENQYITEINENGDGIKIIFELVSYQAGACVDKGNAIGLSEINFSGVEFAGSGTTPVLTINSDLVNSTIINNSYFIANFNASIINNSIYYNCSFYINNTLNETKSDIDLTINQNFTINFSNYESNEWINLSIKCDNANASDDEHAFYFYDVITPLLEETFPETHTQGTNFNYKVNCSDINNFAGNLSITLNADSSEIYYQEYINFIYTTYQWNITNITTSLTLGNYTGVGRCWDSSTNEKLKEKGIILDDGIYFHGIRFYCDNVKTYEIKEKKDRLHYKIKFKDKNTIHSCYYENLNSIPVTKTPYLNHFVDLHKEVWIHEDKGIYNGFSNRIEVTYNTELTDEIITDTIGELNEGILIFHFELIEEPDKTVIAINELTTNLTSVINNFSFELSGGIEMVSIILLLVALLIIGSFTKYKLAFSLSGFVLVWLSMLFGNRLYNLTDVSKVGFYRIGVYGLLLFGLLVVFMGVVFQLFESFGYIPYSKSFKKKFSKFNKKNDFYKNY